MQITTCAKENMMPCRDQPQTTCVKDNKMPCQAQPPRTTYAEDDKMPRHDQPRPCPFCMTLQTHLKRHLFRAHSDKKEIEEIMKLTPRKQKLSINKIRKEGILKVNLTLAMDKNAILLCQKRGKAIRAIKDSVTCSICKGFYSRKTYKKHHCSGSLKKVEVAAVPMPACTVLLNTQEQADEFNNSLLNKFVQDEAGELCRKDELIRLVGEHLFRNAVSRGPKKTDMRKNAMRDMRRLARIFLHVKESAAAENKQLNSVKDIFDRKNFPYLETAILSLTHKDDQTQKNGLKAQLGYLLKTVIIILKGTYLSKEEDEQASQVEKFEAILKLKWRSLFGDAEYANNLKRQQKLRKPEQLPEEGDMLSLRNYTTDQLKHLTGPFEIITNEMYHKIRRLAVCRLTVYNARRSGEPARLLLTEWADAKSGAWLDPNAVSRLEELDRQLINRVKVCYQAGKGVKHLVPILVPNDTEAALDILADQNIRLTVGVHPNNIYLFANIRGSDHHASGWHEVKKCCQEAGITRQLNATRVRHRASTLYASLELPEEQRRHFYSHMGHTEQTNRDIYQCPMAIQEATKVGNFFQCLDVGQPELTGSEFYVIVISIRYHKNLIT